MLITVIFGYFIADGKLKRKYLKYINNDYKIKLITMF